MKNHYFLLITFFIVLFLGTNTFAQKQYDFDGDGKADIVVFRPSTGNWLISQSSGGVRIVNFGQAGDIPVAADYDGDGKTDLAVFRPSTNYWYILRSSDNTLYSTQFGVNGDIAVGGSGQIPTTVTPSPTPSPTPTSTPTPTPSPTVTPTPTPTVTPTPPPPAPAPTNPITLNSSTRYQTMTGWEATAEAAQFYSPKWNLYKNQLLDAAKELGINRLRVEIKSGAENPTDYFTQFRNGQITESEYSAKQYEIINDNSSSTSINPAGFKFTEIDATMDELVMPLKQRLEAGGETLYINVNYVDFRASTFEHKNSPAEYAEFVLATYQHLQSKYGIIPDSWEICLEPDTSAASWSSAQVANAVKAAGDRLVANGFTPHFVAPSTTSAGNTVSYVNQIYQTTGAMQYVYEFSYHRYAGVTPGILRAIAQSGADHGKKTAMLEWIGADYNTLQEDLKVVNNSAWQQYCLAGIPDWGPDNGGAYFMADDRLANPTVTLNSRTKFLRQYFKYIRRGAQRIDATSSNSSFDPVAFINTNGFYTVVVKATTGGNFSIQNLPAGTYGIKFTTDDQYNIDLPDVTISAGGFVPATIPGTGVLTVYRK